MPTVLTHAVVGATIATVARARVQWRLVTAAGISAALPDLDVVTFRLGVPYSSLLGHRGLSHGLVASAMIALAATWLLSRGTALASRMRVWLLLFVATASHGVLDAMTDGGLGVAFFAPFSQARYFFPWRPIAVSPIGARFFSSRGVDVLLSELVWVWVPATVAIGAVWVVGRRHSRG